MYLFTKSVFATALLGLVWLIKPATTSTEYGTRSAERIVESEIDKMAKDEKLATLYHLGKTFSDQNTLNTLVLSANRNDSLINAWKLHKTAYGLPLFFMGNNYMDQDEALAKGQWFMQDKVAIGTPISSVSEEIPLDIKRPWIFLSETRAPGLRAVKPTSLAFHPEFKGFTYAHLSSGKMDMKRAEKARVWLASGDSVAWVRHIKVSQKAGNISEKLLDNKLKTLKLLERANIRTKYISKRRKAHQALLERKIKQESLTLLNNKKGQLPLENTELPYQVWTVGDQDLAAFNRTISQYNGIVAAHFRNLNSLNFKQMVPRRSPIIVAFSSYHIDPNLDKAFLKWIIKHPHITLVNLEAPLNLKYFPEHIPVIQGYEKDHITQELAAQLLFGGIAAKGKLPIHVSSLYYKGAGEIQDAPIRLGYATPEEVGLSSIGLERIATIAEAAIADSTMPGCQVLVARRGKVIYNKAFGYHTYDKRRPVRLSDVYDLASVTKIVATTLAAMRQYEQRALYLSSRIGFYLGDTAKTDFNKILVENLLTHQSGLTSFMPVVPFLHYKDSVTGKYDKFYQPGFSKKYSLKLGERLFMRNDYKDSLRLSLRKQEVNETKSYRYSDINFNILQEILEFNSKTPLDHYVNDFFYHPMGLYRTGYHPMKRLPLAGIVPTEVDKFWRNQLVHGTVHDPAAAIYGGVAGSAGVFSNANELAVIFQMLLNQGEYAGKQYVRPSTITRFTRSQAGTHRGLGFNIATGSKFGPCSSMASKGTYGHRGFTGTCVWADPKEDIIYIFLSNRVYPNDDNIKLRRNQIRERIHSVVYESLMAGPV